MREKGAGRLERIVNITTGRNMNRVRNERGTGKKGQKKGGRYVSHGIIFLETDRWQDRAMAGKPRPTMQLHIRDGSDRTTVRRTGFAQV